MSIQIISHKFLPLLEWCHIPTGKVNLHVRDSSSQHKKESIEVPEFQISKYPVTNGQYHAFLSDPDGYSNPAWWQHSMSSRDYYRQNSKPILSTFVGDKHPRERISWYAAIAFCEWLSTCLDYTVMLPSQAQWQRACQGDEFLIYPWGNTFDKDKCNTVESNIKMTTEVTHYPQGASQFGVYDMVGNVWEWCADSPLDKTSSDPDKRIVKGGSYITPYDRVHANFSFSLNALVYHSSIGFRLIRPTAPNQTTQPESQTIIIHQDLQKNSSTNKPIIKQQHGIFLSSTNDPQVRQYRLAAKAVIEDDEFRDKWYSVEMDEFLPSDSPSLDECRIRVLSCSVYIGILGPFYGTVNDEVKISYTEYEYTVAYDADRVVAIFILPDNILQISPTEIVIKQGALLSRQIEFKERVNQSHMTRSVQDLQEFQNHFRRYLRQLQVKQDELYAPQSDENQFPSEDSYDRKPVLGYTLRDLNWNAVTGFLKTPQAMMVLDRQELLEITEDEHCRIIGLLHQNGNPALGAFLCFARFDQIVGKIAACSLHMVVYNGSDRATSKVIFKEEAEDNLINLYRIGMRFFRTNSGMKRIGSVGTDDRDELEIPTIALREALANALVHRDYEHSASKEQPTRIEVYSNRIEIVSFGNLINGITENLLNHTPESVQPRRRNPTIAKIFMYMQIVELGGSGVARMHHAMRKHNLVVPEITEFGDEYPSVKVTFRRPEILPLQQADKYSIAKPIADLSSIDKIQQSSTAGYVFISYQSSDVEFALRIATDLRNVGVRIWIDRLDMAPGNDWRKDLETAVDKCAAMMVILSPKYVASKYCQRELARADRRNLPIIPILLESLSDHNFPMEIERQQYFDFTNSDEEVYRENIRRLIDILVQRFLK